MITFDLVLAYIACALSLVIGPYMFRIALKEPNRAARNYCFFIVFLYGMIFVETFRIVLIGHR